MSNDSFDFDMDFDGDDFDPDRAGGGGMVDEGSFCFQIINIDPHTEKTGDMDIEMEVVSGTKPSQLGKKHHEYLKYPGPDIPQKGNAARKEMMFLAFCAMKLTTPAELKANNNRFRGDLSMAVGRLVCGKITHVHYTKNDGTPGCKAMLFPDNGEHKYEKNLWAVDNPKAAGIPMPASDGGAVGGSGNGAPVTNGSGDGSSNGNGSSFADDPLAGMID